MSHGGCQHAFQVVHAEKLLHLPPNCDHLWSGGGNWQLVVIGNYPQLLGLEVQALNSLKLTLLSQVSPLPGLSLGYQGDKVHVAVLMVSSARIWDFSPKERLGMVSAILPRLGGC